MPKIASAKRTQRTGGFDPAKADFKVNTPMDKQDGRMTFASLGRWEDNPGTVEPGGGRTALRLPG